MRLDRLLLLPGIAILIASGAARGGSIGTGAFVNPIVDDFTGLGLPTTNTGPLVRPEGTFTFSPVTYRYVDLGGTPYFGEAIGTDAQTGFADLTLSSSTTRAGVWLGASSGTVEFLDASNSSLGTLNYTSPTSGLFFYGWESLSDPIARVIVTDTNAQDGAITFIDRVTTEAPEPAGMAAILGASAFGLIRRRK
jgi:hypothetical protein